MDQHDSFDAQNPHSSHRQPTPTSIPDRRALLAGIGGLAAGAFLAGKANAGPLNPPAGPIASTGKTLGELEPRIAVNATNTPGDATNTFRITQSGSYYLTGNITGEVGKNAILITVSDVTLDLNGFAIQGVPGAAIGVRSSNATTITIANGSVRGFISGVSMTGGEGGNAVRNVCCVDNSVTGFSVANCALTGCRAVSNASAGYVFSGASSALDCSAFGNGVQGFFSDDNTLFERCISINNTSNGFSASGNASYFNCVAIGNANGFASSAAASVFDCIAVDNRQSGISCTGTNAGGVISGCTSRFNLADGIVVSSGLLVRDNTLFRNTNAGIRVTGADNRIEANNATGGALGLSVTGTGNIILHNTCSGNTTNYSIVAGNAVAPIAQATTNAAAINGSTYNAPFGTTDPHANFSY